MKALIISALLCGTAVAQETKDFPDTECKQFAEIRANLLEKYKETPIFHGVTSNGQLITIFHSDKSSTWTATVSAPDGCTQVVSEGGAGTFDAIILNDLMGVGWM